MKLPRFNKKSEKNDQITIGHIKDLEREVSIQIQNDSQVTDEVVAEAKKIADNFSRVIKENNFSLLITVGAARKYK